METPEKNNIAHAPQQELESRVARAYAGQHLMAELGMRLTECGDGHARVDVTLEQKHRQNLGFAHGGIVATLADVATGFAALSVTPEDRRVVTADLNVKFYRPGIGDALYAIGRVDKSGQMLHFCEAEVYAMANGTPELIAKATTIMAIILPPTGEPVPDGHVTHGGVRL